MPESSFPPPTSPPAGWYPDTSDAGVLRYFDGQRWTGEHWGRTVEPAWPPPMPLVAAVGGLAILGASLAAFQLLLDRLVETGWNVPVLLAIVSLLVYGPATAWMLYASRRWGGGRLLRDLGVVPRWSDLAWGALTALVVLVLAAATGALVRAFDIPFRSNLDLDLSLLAVDSRRTVLWSYGLCLVLVAPIVEEALFRGLVLAGFATRLPIMAAVAGQGVLFGAAHFSPRFGREAIGLLLILAVIGIALGAAAAHLRRIAPVVVAHALFNGLGFLAAIHAD